MSVHLSFCPSRWERGDGEDGEGGQEGGGQWRGGIGHAWLDIAYI